MYKKKFLLLKKLSETVSISLFCLVYLVVVFIVLGVEAIEDGSSKREDSGSPGQAVAPVKLVVHPQADRLNELDGEQDQAAHLEHHCREQHDSHRYVAAAPGAEAQGDQRHKEGEQGERHPPQQQGQRGDLPVGGQRAVAGPLHGTDGLPAGDPHGQIVLVIRRDPRWAQYGSDVQAQGEEDAHQTHQLQGRQRRHPHLLCAAHG